MPVSTSSKFRAGKTERLNPDRFQSPGEKHSPTHIVASCAEHYIPPPVKSDVVGIISPFTYYVNRFLKFFLFSLKNLFTLRYNRRKGGGFMISTRGRYAVRIMLDIAKNFNGSLIPLKDIAERQEISKKYLEIIVKDLVSAGLLTAASGKGGGYKLSRSPDEYSIGEILEATEGSLSPVACLEKPDFNCPRASKCETLPMWKEFDSLVRNYFNSKKLNDLIKM